MKAGTYKDTIPLLNEDDYDKTLEELIFQYAGDEPIHDEPYANAGYCVCRVCQVLAPLAAEMQAELARLKDPWTRIDQERPDCLPPYTEHTKVLITQLVDGDPVCKDGHWDGIQFRQRNGSFIPLSLVVAWQPWPDPAPMEEATK
jgi:hypothetical protein